MSDDAPKHEATHLPVLPHSGKVDQLRQEAAMSDKPSEPRPAQPAPGPSAAGKTIEQKLLEGKVIAAISTIFDPEIPVNIYELGLIYAIEVDAEKNVNIRMTLTAPACPVAGTLPGEVEKKVEEVDEVKSAKVELVWDPPWSRDMMSESAMLTLGMY
jgi:FeS assembly SUF system protein